MNYSLTVIVNSADIPSLKEAGYQLCLAKKVNGTFNVLWKGGNFFYRNVFTWSSKYQVFGSNDYVNGALVQENTQVVAIQPGQTATLDASGSMHNAGGTPNNSGTFHVSNQYGTINIGVNALLNGTYAPIYVSPPFVSGPVDLTPEEEVLVWLDTTYVTGAMITESISNSIPVDFKKVASRSVTYGSPANQPGHGTWSLDGQVALSSTYDVRTNRFTVEKPALALLSQTTSILAASRDSGVTTPRVKATAWFAPGGADEFADYLRNSRPDWDVASAGFAVEVGLVPTENGLNIAEAARSCENAFLKVYRGFRGEPYTKITFETVNLPDEQPEPTVIVAQAIAESTGKAVFRFSNSPDAQSFATKTAAASGAGVTFVGVLRGVAVVVTASFDSPTRDVLADRQKVAARLAQRIEHWHGEDPDKSLIYGGPLIWKKDP